MPSYAIAGASRGIGFEYVKQLSATPTNTVIALVRKPASATKLQALAAERPGIHVIPADVTDPESLIAAAAATSDITGGKLDVLIHNAAELDMSTMGLTPSTLPFNAEAIWAVCRGEMNTSAFGAVWSTNAFLPLIKKGVEKKVIHMTTGMADVDFIKDTKAPQAIAMAIAKASLNVITAKYASEFADEGIKFLALSPGWVNTAEGPIPPEMMPMVEALLSQFRRVEPDLQGPISVEDSVRMQLEVIGRLDAKLSGQFLSHHGDKNWF